MNKLFAVIVLCAACAPSFALEIKAAQPQCTSADVRAGKALWNAIDKASDGSEVVVTNTENRQLWCYNDATNPAGRPDATLKVSVRVTPDPDEDLDGVPDASDKCKGTLPSCADCVSRPPVDAKGCPK